MPSLVKAIISSVLMDLPELSLKMAQSTKAPSKMVSAMVAASSSLATSIRSISVGSNKESDKATTLNLTPPLYKLNHQGGTIMMNMKEN